MSRTRPFPRLLLLVASLGSRPILRQLACNPGRWAFSIKSAPSGWNGCNFLSLSPKEPQGTFGFCPWLHQHVPFRSPSSMPSNQADNLQSYPFQPRPCPLLQNRGPCQLSRQREALASSTNKGALLGRDHTGQPTYLPLEKQTTPSCQWTHMALLTWRDEVYAICPISYSLTCL